MLMKNDENFGTICVCAVRYALGRRTYMPSIVQEFVGSNIDQIDNNSLAVMHSDVKSASNYGDDLIDRPDWMLFQSKLEEELAKRGVRL